MNLQIWPINQGERDHLRDLGVEGRIKFGLCSRCETYKLKMKVCTINHGSNNYLQYCMPHVSAFMAIISYIKSQNTLRKDNCTSNFQ